MDRVTKISALIILMVLLLPVAAKLMKRRPRTLKLAKICILSAYMFANLYLTLLSRNARGWHSVELGLFWSYAEALQGNGKIGVQIILNILLYIPLGYLLRFTFPRIKPWQVVLIGCIASVLTETCQYLFKLGLCELDDVFHNTLGTFVGVVCYWGMKKLMKQPLE